MELGGVDCTALDDGGNVLEELYPSELDGLDCALLADD